MPAATHQHAPLAEARSPMPASAPAIAEAPPDCYTVEQLFDMLDTDFVSFFGEYGRGLVNSRREKWNRDGAWSFQYF